MPEDITQRLGFDASKAVQELIRLRGELNTFKQSLQSVSGALRKFPSAASPAVKAFRELSTAAATAATSIQSVAAAGGATQAAAAVTNSFNQASRSMQGTAQAATAAGNATQSASSKTAQGAAATAQALDKAGKAGTNAARDIGISWKTIGRVIQAQVIVRGVNLIIGAFKDAHDSAREFSVAVAEAFTISGGALGSLDQMNEGVKQVALNLGESADVVAEGVYQTLSNQVTEAGDALRFTNEAGKLAVATQSDLKSAVNALSSVMNSYNLSVSETTRVSNVLFKTVELGRLRLSEFGDVLGRVSPLAAELGISYEEMAGAIAAMTQKGVPAHTAITQLTQVMQKTLRPTEKMQALYEQWGVETGPEAIARFGGLQGILLKMKDSAQGNVKVFSDYFGRVRALVGALNLASNEAESFTDATQQMLGVTTEVVDAQEKIRQAVGRDSVEAWNNLKTTMLDTGGTLLKITTPIATALKVVAENMGAIIATATGAGIAFLVMRSHAAAATAQVTGLKIATLGLGTALKSIGPIAIAAGAAFGAIKLGEMFANWSDQTTELNTETAKATEALSKKHEEESQRRIQATRREFTERRKLTGDFYAGLAQLYQKDLDLVEASGAAVGKTLEAVIGTLMKKRADAIKTIKEAILEADDAVKTSGETITNAREKLEDLAWKKEQRRLGARKSAIASLTRARKAAAQARASYATVGADEEKAEAARKSSESAEERAREAINAAKTLKDLKGVKKGEAELKKILQDRIEGETAFQNERRALRSKAHRERLSQIEEEGRKLDELLEKYKELADPLEDGAPKAPSQRAADVERMAELAPIIAEQLNKAFDFSMFDKLGLEAGLSDLKFGVARAFDDARVDWTKITDDLQATLSARELEASVTLRIKNQAILEEFVKKFGEIDPLADPGKTTSQMEGILEDIVKETENLHSEIDKSAEAAVNSIDQLQKRLDPQKFFGGTERAWAKAAAMATAANTGIRESTEDVNKKLADQNKAAESLRQGFIKLLASLKETAEAGKPLSKSQGLIFHDLIETAKALRETDRVSTDTGNALVEIGKHTQTATKHIKTMTAAQEALEELDPTAYEAALNHLEEMRQSAKQTKDEQAGITDAIKSTEQVLVGVNKAQQDSNSSAVQGKSALDAEAESANQLKTILEGAAKASKEIKTSWEITQQPDVFGAPGLDVPGGGEPISLAELERRTAAARVLATEITGANTQFIQATASAQGLAEAIRAPAESAAQIRDAFASVDQAIRTMSTSMPIITEQLIASSSTANALTTALTQSANAASATNQATNSLTSSLAGAASAGNTMAAAMKAAAAAATAAAQACAAAAKQCAGGGVNASHGGRFFAAGGRGTDTIPAMLTPGEFVVNARSARDFFPQLQAINAGQRPIYRDQGGPVTTTNVGDVNVTVQGGESSSQTIREIGKGLQRELRRKTIKLY